MDKPLISVIVCTYNRSQLLRTCLESLVAQNLDNSGFEVVIVDNNSTDDTPVIAQCYVEQYAHFRAVVASQQGLSFARNIGWQQAKGQYVAYIDDDAIAEADWLSVMAQFIAENPDIQAFGGPYEAFSLSPLPDWFPPEYGRLSFGERNHPIQLVEEWIPGSNMVFAHAVFGQVGGFDERLGMNGAQAAYMEEIDFLLRLQAHNIQTIYVHNLMVRHLIADYKMNLKWLLLSTYAAGRSAQKTFMKERSGLSHSAALLKTFFSIFWVLLSPRPLPLQRRLYYALQWFMWELGAFRGFIQFPTPASPTLSEI